MQIIKTIIDIIAIFIITILIFIIIAIAITNTTLKGFTRRREAE